MIRKFINKWIHKQSNAEQVIFAALNDLGIKVNRSSLIKDLENYPYPYTLLQIHDILENYNVGTFAIKAPWNNIKHINGGYFCQIILKGKDYFTYVYQSDGNKVSWLNPQNGHRETDKPSEFLNKFTSYALIVNAKDSAGEMNYGKLHLEEIRQNILQSLILLCLPFLFVSSLCMSIANGNQEWSLFLYAIFLFIGCIIGIVLMIYEYDAYNPIATNICGHSRKYNCSSILESSGSRFFNVPWTVWGCSYFSGMISAIMSSEYSEETYTMVAILHLFALPYVFYSLYYQKFIIKQWCPLCLLVQVDIVVLSLIAFFSGCYFNLDKINLTTIPTIGISLFISFVMMYLMWFNFQQRKHKNFYKRKFQEVKYNPVVFNSLLKREPKINDSNDGYGIILGNPKGSTHIIIVCNPYCRHCAAAQKVLVKMLETNNDIRVQMIFIMGPDYDGYEQTPVDTFLSLVKEGEDVISILDDWYSMHTKNIDLYNERHPVKHRRTKENDDNARQMNKFCEKMKITVTPTVFLNGYQLPALYNVDDLKYFV